MLIIWIGSTSMTQCVTYYASVEIKKKNRTDPLLKELEIRSLWIFFNVFIFLAPGAGGSVRISAYNRVGITKRLPSYIPSFCCNLILLRWIFLPKNSRTAFLVFGKIPFKFQFYFLETMSEKNDDLALP